MLEAIVVSAKILNSELEFQLAGIKHSLEEWLDFWTYLQADAGT